MNKKELDEILDKHLKWLHNEKDGERANLSGADLRYADLRDADLRDADLSGANLSGADLRDAKNVYLPQVCPEKGSFIGFKKALTSDAQVIVELLIPEDARRSSSTSRKCRCSKAKVLSITPLDGKEMPGLAAAYSFHDNTFLYKVGETVEVDNFDPDRWNECAPGIHFFITREEAVRY